MKKITIITIVSVLTVVCGTTVSAQQNIPSKLLKGIEATTDEFTGVTTYSAKNCCLSIEQSGDSVRLYIGLSCSQFDTPVKLTAIHILSGGKTTTIQHNENFNQKEVPVRVMTQNSTGRFGTTSYKGAQFDTRNQYIETWREDATLHMPLVESLANNAGKVKFEGENNTLYMEFTIKDAQRMASIMRLYEWLRQN
jgi:hypothetical protein